MSLRRLHLILSLRHRTSPRSHWATIVGTPIIDRIYWSRFFSSLMRRSVVQQGGSCRHKSGTQSAVAHYGCCMGHESAIVARVRSMNNVKNRRPPSKPNESVPSTGLSLHLHQRTLDLHWLPIQCFGGLARTLSSARAGETSSFPTHCYPTG